VNRAVKSLVRRVLPSDIRPHRILSGPLQGHWIITSWRDYPAAITGRTERPLLCWFSANVEPGETWLDIGAHYGYTAIALGHLVGAAGRVFAFEPMLSTAGHLSLTKRMNDLPQLTVVPMGLAASPDLAVKVLPATRGMVDSTLQDGRAVETILVARLDWLWPQICGDQRQIDGIKIDVQGMEIEVLRGMTCLLSEWRPRLVVEFHAGVDRSELLDLIAGAGYCRQATTLEPIAGEAEPLYVDDRSYAFEASAL